MWHEKSLKLWVSFCFNTFRCWSMPHSWFIWCCQESPGDFWGSTAFWDAYSSSITVPELPPGVWSVRRDEYAMNTFAPWKKKEFAWSERLYALSCMFNSWVLLFWWVAKCLAEERCSFIPSATKLGAPLLCSWKIHLCQSPRRGSIVFFLACTASKILQHKTKSVNAKYYHYCYCYVYYY